MIKTVLVPLDGSKRAEYPLPLATQIVRHADGTLVLVRVVNIATDYWPTATVPYPSMMQAIVNGELENAATYLEIVAAATELPRQNITTVAQHGAVSPIILASAVDSCSDLILLCSHGSTGMTHMIMGNVAKRIARHASIPVLIVRERQSLLVAVPSSGSRKDLDESGLLPGKVYSPNPHRSGRNAPGSDSVPLRVLVPLDGSAHALAALSPVAALLTALTQQATLHLVRVVAPDRRNEIQRAEEDLSQAKLHLSQVAEMIQEGALVPEISQQHIAVTWSVVLESDIARAIVHLAEHDASAQSAGGFGGCDLIAMSTHGLGGLQHLMMGSVTERVLHTTRHPLLIVRPPEVVDKQKAYLELN